MSAKNIWILRGEGIECEKESFRFFSQPEFKARCEYISVPELLQDPAKVMAPFRAGDWVLFPGGFSFADHLGSGRLLSFKFQEKKIYDQLLAKKMHLMGICNGFQILCGGHLFGQHVSLERNQPGGFVNQWVRLKGWQDEDYYFTCRHGEGRLKVDGALSPDTRVLLRYNDDNFNNGSFEKIAGLVARKGESYVVGLMPHPEIALRAMDQADFVGPEHPGEFAARMEEKEGDGVRFFRDLVVAVEEKKLV